MQFIVEQHCLRNSLAQFVGVLIDCVTDKCLNYERKVHQVLRPMNQVTVLCMIYICVQSIGQLMGFCKKQLLFTTFSTDEIKPLVVTAFLSSRVQWAFNNLASITEKYQCTDRSGHCLKCCSDPKSR